MSPENVRSRLRTWSAPALLVLGMFAAAAAGFVFVNQVLLVGQPVPSAGGDPKTMGNLGAPVELVEYSDYQ
ncbi:MAG: hypothetical protein M1389_12600 [Chloroflexi bacterium]|nr:hypothetical protein [Chloroflexota bacterium]